MSEQHGQGQQGYQGYQGSQGYQSPYGDQGYVAPTYQQTPYGAVASTYERAPVMRRPGTAVAAGVITIVLAVLYLLAGVAVIVLAAVVGSAGGRRDGLSALGTALGGLFAIVGGFVALAAVLYLVLGILVLKRQQWARITLTVLLAMGVLGNLGGLRSEHRGWWIGLGGGGLALAVILLVLLWVPPTTAWFSSRSIVAPPVYPPVRPPYGR